MRTGWVHVICGCMYSGKTAELVRHLVRAEIAGRQVVLLRPVIDDRTPTEVIQSRAGSSFPSVGFATSAEIAPAAAYADVIGIEEAQFVDEGLVDVVERLADAGRQVYVSGLDRDFAGRPFGAMPMLLALADQVTKLTAICMVCGEEATRTQRLYKGAPAKASDSLVVIGGVADDRYEARCRRHHVVAAD